MAAVRRVAPREWKRALEKVRRRACTTIEVRQNSWIRQCNGDALDALPRSCTSTTRRADVQGRHRGEVVQGAASLVSRPTMSYYEALASGSKT